MTIDRRPTRLLCLTATAAVILCLPPAAQAQSIPTQSTADKKPTTVSVVESIPLSVTGTVTISDVPAVTVTNTAAAPVPVRDVDRAASEPFQTGTPPTFFPTNFGSAALVTVPAGKRLVIKYVSAWINTAGEGGLLATSLAVGGHANDLTCHAQGQNALNHIFSCATPTVMYVEAGQTLSFLVQTLANTGGNFRAFVSGHYESVQ